MQIERNKQTFRKNQKVVELFPTHLTYLNYSGF